MSEPSVERLSKIEAVQFIPTWYDSAQADHFWMRKRFEFITEAFKQLKLPTQSALRVLDIGSGSGVAGRQIESQTAWTVDCADLDENALKMGTTGRGRRLFYNIHDRHPELLGKYDVVILLDVLEHIPEPQDFLRSALAHLKPGGRLILNVPALPMLFSRYDDFAGHCRRYTKKSLLKELSGAGLRTEFLRYWGMSWVPLLLLRKFMVRKMKKRDDVIKLGFQPKSDWIGKALEWPLDLELRIPKLRFVGSSLIYVGALSHELPA